MTPSSSKVRLEVPPVVVPESSTACRLCQPGLLGLGEIDQLGSSALVNPVGNERLFSASWADFAAVCLGSAYPNDALAWHSKHEGAGAPNLSPSRGSKMDPVAPRRCRSSGRRPSLVTILVDNYVTASYTAQRLPAILPWTPYSGVASRVEASHGLRPVCRRPAGCRGDERCLREQKESSTSLTFRLGSARQHLGPRSDPL